ncbi:MAG: oligosaccharide flippase family protein [Puia sp.]|nr:oligosaccharide flippase family protein [Puia sp.]
MISNIISKLKGKHFLSLSGNAVMSVFGMLTLSILYRSLPVAGIGAWVFFQSTLGLIDTFRSGFLTTAFIKFYAGTDSKRATDVVGSTWFVGGAITAGLVVLNILAVLFMPPLKNEGLALCIKWFGICYVSTLPSFISSCVVQAEQRYDRLLYIRFLTQSLFVLGILCLVVVKQNNIEHVVYAFLISNVLTSIFCISAGYSRIGSFFSRTGKTIRELYHFGKYSVGTNLSSNMFRASDTYIVNFMLGEAAVAIYNLGLKLMELVEIPLRSFAATAMASLSEAYNQDRKSDVIYILRKYIGIITVSLIPVSIGAVLFANIAIGIMGGSKFIGTEAGIQAANVFRMFMIVALLYPADRYMGLTIDVIHRPGVNFVKVLIMLSANIIGDFVGVHWLGNVYGIVIMNLFPAIIGIWISNRELQKYMPYRFFSLFNTGYSEIKMYIRKFI